MSTVDTRVATVSINLRPSTAISFRIVTVAHGPAARESAATLTWLQNTMSYRHKPNRAPSDLTLKKNMKFWILGPKRDGVPVVVEVDIHEWSKWFGFQHERRRVGWTVVPGMHEIYTYDSEFVKHTTGEEPAHVSTVFLGIDHSYGCGDEPPVLFETMVFGGPWHEEMERYCTWEEAAAGHARWVEKCTNEVPDGVGQ